MEQKNGDETYAVFRAIYECSLIIRRLDVDPEYAQTLLAQALAGSEIFPFRIKKNGQRDFGKLVDVKTGVEYDARTSFSACAAVCGDDDLTFFNIIYPVLSYQVHFDAANMIKEYRRSGSFLLWKENKPELQALYAITVLLHCMISIGSSNDATAKIRRDAGYMIDNYQDVFRKLVSAMNEDKENLDETTMLVAVSTFKIFSGEPFDDLQSGLR